MNDVYYISLCHILAIINATITTDTNTRNRYLIGLEVSKVLGNKYTYHSSEMLPLALLLCGYGIHT